jgi:hypothetical protein
MGWKDYVPFMGGKKAENKDEKPKKMCCACPDTKVPLRARSATC